jgi:hypothetical protein
MKPKIVRYSILLVLLAGLDLYSVLYLNDSRDRALQAKHDTEICRNLAHRIVALQSKPTIAGSAAPDQDNLTRRIEDAARVAGVSADNLASIEPDPSARIGDTSYVEKPTVVQIRNVNLQQLASMLCRLADDGSGLRIESLRLTVPPEQPDGNLWSAEFTLTYLIYLPLPTARQVAQRS